MDLTTISFEEYRKIQRKIRRYVEAEVFRSTGMRVNNLERLSINEIIRTILELSSGDIKELLYDGLSDEEKKKKWTAYARRLDETNKDAVSLFLRNYGINQNDHYSNRGKKEFKQRFSRYRDECIKG
jgi:hypothetical protein